VEQNLARVKRTLDKLEKSKVQDESTKKAIAFLKQTIARETFDLYSLKYEIKQRSAYIQKQGFDLSDTVRKFNPKKDALGTLPAWLTAKAVALILVCLVVVLASVWFFFIHESPAKRVLTNLQNELEEVRDRLKDQCAGRNDKYCDTLADRAKELQELVDKAREEVAKEKNVIETISNEAVTTITTFGELSKYALYGVFGLGVLWGAVKAIDIVKKRNAQENQA
jgi:peptidoglycan hydrolase CwlO-like protein